MTLPFKDASPQLRFLALSAGLVAAAAIVYIMITLTFIGLGMLGLGTDCSPACTAP